MKFITLFLLFFLLASGFNLHAESEFQKNVIIAEASFNQDLHDFLDRWRHQHNITSAVVSVQDTLTGKVSSYTSGTTTLDGKTMVTDDALFGVGSITKTFIAATMLQLQEEGTLKLDDPIGSYFPQFPRWKKITIRQLLNMTSGITNFTSLPAFTALQKTELKKIITPEQFIKMAYAAPDKFAPGAAWHYSNTNYYLLGMMIEKITRQPVGSTLTKRFFRTLHLKHTFYSDSFYTYHVIKQMAHAYVASRQLKLPVEVEVAGIRKLKSNKSLVEFKDITAFNPSFYGAAGGMVMDAGDLRTWTSALLTPGIILKKTSIDEMQTTIAIPPSPPKPEGCRYGLGIYSLNVPKLGNIWYYAGVIPGYTSCFVSIPSQHKVIVAQAASWPERHFEILFPGQALMHQLLD